MCGSRKFGTANISTALPHPLKKKDGEVNLGIGKNNT